MSQFREHQLQQQIQQSPSSRSGSAVDTVNITGTPNRLIAFSPNASSVKSVSKIIQTPDRDEVAKGLLVFSPTHSNGSGFRTTGVPVDKDPFVTPSSKSKMKNNQQLSATASSFRPFYDNMSSDDSGEDQPPTAEEQESLRLSQPDQVSPVLSTDLFLSRCVEFSSSPQSGSTTDIETFLSRLASLGSPCLGGKTVIAKNNKVYVRYNNIRDACVSHRNVHICGSGWTAKFLLPPDFVQLATPGDIYATAHEGQLDMLAVLLHNAPMELSQVEPHVFKLLQAEGDLFAFQKDRRSEEGALKAIIEYSDFTIAMSVASKLNGLMIDGLHIRLSFYQPDAHTGRAAPPNDGVTTPMPTPGRFPPPGGNVPAFQGQQDSQPQKLALQHGPNTLAPVRHQPTPPSSGIGAPPQQVALVPMVLRNPYAPGTPIILDPYGPPGSAMGPMGPLGAMGTMGGMPGMGPITGGPLVFPPGTPMQTIVGQPAGYEAGQRSGPMGRYGNRRNAMRMDRSMQFGTNGHHNQVDVNRIRDGVDVRTTIMLRNIPNKVDQRMLKAIIDESSWGKYDFMYLRIDFANDCNVGYAFINFADLYYTVGCPTPELAGREEEFPGPDNPSKMKRSCENAEHVGLFTPHLSQYYRDEQRRRRSQFDRGTRMAALEEYDYDTTLQRMYMPQ
ncbi:hypothetical protein SEUCBS139899_006293 [Sporothrix eucalyptigena]